MALVHYSTDIPTPRPGASKEELRDWAEADSHERDCVRTALYHFATLAMAGLAAKKAMAGHSEDDGEAVYTALVELSGLFHDERRASLLRYAENATAPF